MDKVNRQIQKMIMEIIQKEVDDPAMDFLSITRVDTTRDLQESKVYYSLLTAESLIKAKDTLSRMGGFIRGQLGKKMRLKVLPQLRFIPDESMRHSVDIYKKIEEINKLEGNNEKESIEEDS
ncbi:MAG: 30S ribosome-binding factor RbfA [Candidatus Omnitrophica bacterium]|nr:30S ribosome-binding factor RbfA [Candidatus Omnitrophota bacterium]